MAHQRPRLVTALVATLALGCGDGSSASIGAGGADGAAGILGTGGADGTGAAGILGTGGADGTGGVQSTSASFVMTCTVNDIESSIRFTLDMSFDPAPLAGATSTLVTSVTVDGRQDIIIPIEMPDIDLSNGSLTLVVVGAEPSMLLHTIPDQSIDPQRFVVDTDILTTDMVVDDEAPGVTIFVRAFSLTVSGLPFLDPGEELTITDGIENCVGEYCIDCGAIVAIGR